MGFSVPKAKRWDGGIIPYAFKTDPKKLPDGRLQAFFVACMRRWERFVNVVDPLVQFVEWDGDESKPHLLIDLSDFSEQCPSSCPLGRPDGKVSRFTFNMYRADEYKSIPHELGHALGLAHEHLRNAPANLKAWQKADEPHLYPVDQWQVVSQSGAKGKYEEHGSYDLRGIMHYPSAKGWSWSRDAWNKEENLKDLLAAVNYPTCEEIENDTWWLSAEDITTVQDLYAS